MQIHFQYTNNTNMMGMYQWGPSCIWLFSDRFKTTTNSKLLQLHSPTCWVGNICLNTPQNKRTRRFRVYMLHLLTVCTCAHEFCSNNVARNYMLHQLHHIKIQSKQSIVPPWKQHSFFRTQSNFPFRDVIFSGANTPEASWILLTHGDPGRRDSFKLMDGP